jgi:6,7-dimethyl-8-ribityllumazine synthase
MVASKSKSPVSKEIAQGKRFGLVVSRYHEDLTEELLQGAVKTLQDLGARKDDVQSVWVPGSFEIPLAARAMLHQQYDAVICLGIIIKGETTHNEYIAREVARGISQLAQASGTPVIFGILTTQTLEQAKARCGGTKGNKGIEAAEAAVSMLQVLDDIKKLSTRPGKSVGFGF